MSAISQGNIKMAINAMRATKLRSFLTMLGIIIGVVSVITVVGIGEGIKNQVNGQINQLGRDLITVRPGRLVKRSNSGSISSVNLFSGVNSYGVLTQQDLQVVQKTSGVKSAVPLGLVNGRVDTGSRRPTSSVPIIATSAALPTMLHQQIAFGGFFGKDISEQPNVAVLGQGAAEALFQQQAPLGRTFTLLGQTFYVRGVLSRFDTNPLSLSTDFNNAIFIPYQTAQALTSNNTRLFEVLAKPKDSSKTTSTVDDITAGLLKAHQNQQQFTVLRQDETLAVTNNIMDLLTRLIAGIAAISLLVGGVGIMDVMLVSVAERMHEIGIRKALGATNSQILNQFLVEATVLSLTGGAIGIVVAFVIDFILHTFTSFTPFITWQVVVLATVVSLLVGIVFGSVPALKAARKDPINALRNE